MRWQRLLGFAWFVVVVGCSSSDDAAPPGEIRLPDSRCRAIGIASCENGGRCVEEQGVAKCACESGWTGTSCTECAPGRSCAAASCAATKCAAHATCSEANGPPTCSCVTGYAIENQTCVWKGVLRDPGFANEPAGVWSVTSATFNPTATAAKDRGSVDFAGLCDPNASKVTQTVAMPPFEQSDPLALETTGVSHCMVQVDLDVFIDAPCGAPSVAFGTRNRALAGFDLASTTTFQCLGEKAFGKTLALTFRPSVCDPSMSALTLDRADIVPKPDCPLPGQIVNANFEGVGGWAPEGLGAEVVPGVGNQSSRGGRLKKAMVCEAPALRGQISLQRALPKPALVFTARGNAGRRMRIFGGAGNLGNVLGTGVFQTATVCLPDYMKGEAETLLFSAGQDRRTTSCTATDDYEFVFDELELKSDPSCPDAAPIVDGGFERPDSDRYWWADGDLGFINFPKNAGARTGTGHATISHVGCQKFSTLSSVLTIPEPMAGAGGAAVEFAYRAPAANNQTFIGPGGTMPASPDWTVLRRCLPKDPGAPYTVGFSLSSANNCQPTSLSIDDVKVVYDAACPE